MEMKKDIVLIPGALATPTLWYNQENHFNGKMNFHHVDVKNSYSISDMAARFAQKSPDKFTLMGFSMGGYIALELFRYIPHKIDKLILINSSAKPICKGYSLYLMSASPANPA